MAARTGPRKIQRYTAEFKLKAVKLTQIEGIQVKDVAESLDIHPLITVAQGSTRWSYQGQGIYRPNRQAGRRSA